MTNHQYLSDLIQSILKQNLKVKKIHTFAIPGQRTQMQLQQSTQGFWTSPSTDVLSVHLFVIDGFATTNKHKSQNCSTFIFKEIKPLKHFGGALKNIKTETVKKEKNADALWLVTG